MYTWKKRLLAAILAGCMSIGLMTPALAVEGEATQPTPTPEVTESVAPTDEVDPSFSVDPTTEPTAEPTEEPAETPAETPATEPTETPAETPSSEPTETPAETPSSEPTETPAETPTTEPTETPAETPTTEPTESPEITDIPEETIPGGALPGETLSDEEVAALLDRLMACGSSEELWYALQELSDIEWKALEDYAASIGVDIESTKQFAAGEVPTLEIVEGTMANVEETVNFTNAAPLVKAADNAESMAEKYAVVAPMAQMQRALMLPGNATPLNEPEVLNDSEEGLILDKYVTYDPESKEYKITLESYVTGSVSTSTSSKPTDIVLVLDQSGSMGDKYVDVYESYEEYNRGFIDIFWNHESLKRTNDLCYRLPNGTYTRLEVSYSIFTGYIYSWIDENGVEQQLSAGWLPTGGPDSRFDNNLFVGINNQAVSKKIALQTAANNFVKAVAEDAVANNVDHRIAVVGFASSAENYNDKEWENTELLSTSSVVAYNNIRDNDYADALVSANVNGAVNSRLTEAINRLDAQGGTWINYGLEMAQGVFENTDGTDRNRVIVVLTDGTPGDGTWDGRVENDTCASAALDVALTLKNSDVSIYSVGIFNGANALSAGSNNGTVTEKNNYFLQNLSSNNGVVQDPSYYLSAGDAEALNEIFESISSSITTPSVELDETAVIKDVVSRYFKLPDGMQETDVSIYTSDCTGGTAGNYTFAEERTPYTQATVHIDASSKTVEVSGFDFSAEENVVTGTGGKKLIVEFTIVPEPDFVGGNDVETNTSASGVYNKGTALGTFDIPTANVPIDLDKFSAKNANVYYGNEVPEIEQLITWNGTAFSDLQDWQKEFVKIDRSSTADFSTTASGQYTANIVVAPTTGGEQTEADGGGTANVEQTATAIGTVNVFKLHLTYQDTTINLNETPNYDRQNLVSRAWKNSDGVESTDATITMMGSEPVLSIEYSPTEEAFKTDQNVSVTVKKDDTEYAGVEFVWQENSNSSECTADGCTAAPTSAHFRVHVLIPEFTFTLTKRLDKVADGEQSFIFKITEEDETTPYMVVALVIPEGQTEASKKITLPSGTYTIEEDNDWSWQYEKNEQSETVSEEGATIIFTNTKDSNTHWLGGSHSVENEFESVKSGSNTLSLNELNPAAQATYPRNSSESTSGNDDDKNKDQNTEPDPSEPMETQEGGVSNV